MLRLAYPLYMAKEVYEKRWRPFNRVKLSKKVYVEPDLRDIYFLLSSKFLWSNVKKVH